MCRKLCFFVAVVCPVLLWAAPSETDKISFYDSQVRPIVEEHCLKCHGGDSDKVKGNLSLTSRENVLEGGDFGPAGDLEKPGESLLLKMISYQDDEHQMPPKGKLSDEKRAVFAEWAEMGFPFNPATEVVWKAPVKADDPTVVNDENRNWWSYRPVVNHPVPEVKDASWQKNPIDAFVKKRLNEEGLTPNTPADRAALLRRTYYNLIGLPPSSSETLAFVNDTSPNAFEKVVDELLARPQYGEKWGRHWLDIVRFAESDGYERDSIKPQIWRYRDYVIDALNQDVPYDQFIMEQLAGDEMAGEYGAKMIATGFYRLGTWDDEPADRELNRYDVLDGIAATTGEAFLGMTIGCARCHDHKIDPMPIEDYYSFVSFFRNVTDYTKGKGNIVSVMGQREQASLEKDLREKALKEHRLITQIYQQQKRFREALIANSQDFTNENLPLSVMENVRYKFYRNTFKKLPEFDKLRAENTGMLKSNFFDIGIATRKDAMGMVFEGNLVLLRDGDYTFAVDSKDGSRLLVNGKVVVDHDGLHPMGQTKVGKINLKKGVVPVRFEYFNTVGEPGFKVGMAIGNQKSLLSMPQQFRRDTVMLPDSQVDRQTWAYTFSKPANDWSKPNFDDSGWKAGKGGFGSAGTPKAIIGTPWTSKEIWLRRDFDLSRKPAEVTMSIHYDEDAEVFINGQLVKKFKGYTKQYQDITIAGDALRVGRNTIAVYCRNAAGGQYIDVGLYDKGGIPDINDLLIRNAVAVKVMNDKQVHKFRDSLRSLEASRKVVVAEDQVEAMVVKETGDRPRDTHVLLRGNPHVKGDKVEPRFPSILTDEVPVINPPPSGTRSTGRRYALGKWISSKENPLTARVMVNRIWQHHFGRGIVRSSSNFGRVGERPSHPELLDWLAWDFMHDKNWSIKKMHKQILLSRTYQMSSAPNDENFAKDPRNDHFWRYDMRRLTAEEIRDSLISLTGNLNLKMGGKSFYSKIPDAILATSSTKGGKWGRSSDEERNRRSVYILVRRSLLDPMLTGFDLADTDAPCAVRFATTVPTQALTMLNGEFVNGKALQFAERLRNEASDAESQVRRGLELATSRVPTSEEVQRGVEFLAEIKAAGSLDDRVALDRFALLCMNLNEFMFLD